MPGDYDVEVSVNGALVDGSLPSSLNRIDISDSKTQRLLNMSVNEALPELSARPANCLKRANITTVGQLVVIPERQLIKFRNLGQKSLNEIKEKLHDLGLVLGMTFPVRWVEPRMNGERIEDSKLISL